MRDADINKVLKKAMDDFQEAYVRLQYTLERYERTIKEETVQDKKLVDVKEFRSWHEELLYMNEEDLGESYSEYYLLTIHGKSIKIPYHADTYELVAQLLDKVIEEW